MHIVLGIIGAIAALSYYFFVFRRAGQAATQAVDMAQQFRGKMRRNAFRKKAEGSVLTSVKDPGTAAAVLLIKIAECDGPVIAASKQEITKIIRNEIGMEDADEVIPFAEWVCGQAVNPADIIRKLKPLWVENLNSTQRAEFVDMAQRIANLSGKPNQEQKEIIRQMRERLLS
ncbi:MAG: TerB family tellurite resistance protein [Pseudomonadota bacterium]